VSALLTLLLASAPVLEAELDSQTREDDELPPASILPYTPRPEVLRKAVGQLQKALATDPRAGDDWLATGGKGSTVPRR
jgi:hypothetical protein